LRDTSLSAQTFLDEKKIEARINSTIAGAMKRGRFTLCARLMRKAHDEDLRLHSLIAIELRTGLRTCRPGDSNKASSKFAGGHVAISCGASVLQRSKKRRRYFACEVARLSNP